ncbi:MAG: hypothetical protein RLZZ350_1883 [Verrucomicrobiota bacterium]|jgi:hypothetical protein
METQFEFLRYSFQKLSQARAKEFFVMKRTTESSRLELGLKKASELGVEAEIIESVKQSGKKRLIKKWGGENRELYQEQYVPDDLNKSELLLLVALFESYLKEFYEALIRAEPRRAFAKSGKQENLREIFSDNVEVWRSSKFFQKVVVAEVDRFDHTPFCERMDFLTEAYELKHSEKDIKTANDLIDRRHKISHRWTDRNEVKHVSPQDLSDTRRILRSIPGSLITQASKKYPRHFNY